MGNNANHTQERGGLGGLIAVLIGFFLFFFLLGFAWSGKRSDTVARSYRSSEERLETLREHRAREASELTSYGWINRDQEVVRLPIDRAMELLLDEMKESNN